VKQSILSLIKETNYMCYLDLTPGM